MDGPVFLRSCKNCQVYVACRQFRCRNLEDCDIYLWCFNDTAIIELSNDVRFHDFNLTYQGLDEHFKLANLAGNTGKVDEIYDFSPPKPGEPLHYSVISDPSPLITIEVPTKTKNENDQTNEINENKNFPAESFGSDNVTSFGSDNVQSFGSDNQTSFGSDNANVTSFGSDNVQSFGSDNVTSFGSAKISAGVRKLAELEAPLSDDSSDEDDNNPSNPSNPEEQTEHTAATTETFMSFSINTTAEEAAAQIESKSKVAVINETRNQQESSGGGIGELSGNLPNLNNDDLTCVAPTEVIY